MKCFFRILFFTLLIPVSFSYAKFVDQDLVTQVNGSMVSIGGKINTTTNPLFKTFSIKGYLSTDPTFATFIKTGVPPTKAVANDGTYGWTFPDLAPSTTYHFKQQVSDGKTTEESKVYPITTIAATASGSASSAGSQSDFDKRSYRLLAPFPGLSVLLDPDLCQEQKLSGKNGQICDINDFLNYMFKLLVSLAAVLLVLRLVYEGYQYIVTDIPFLKANAKSGFMEALGGLALALSAYLILNTVNPKLVENTISINKVAVSIEGDTNAPVKFVSNGKMPSDIYCPKTGKGSSVAQIAQSFSGKVTYNMGGKDPSATRDGTAILDCSGYVVTVLDCAGYKSGSDYINSGTSDIFSNAEKITSVTTTAINGKELRPGDLVGWVQGQKGEKFGHVLIYIGNGRVMDSHGGGGKVSGKAIGNYSLDFYKARITYIKRIPS